VCVCCLGVVHAPVQFTCCTLPPFRMHRSSHQSWCSLEPGTMHSPYSFAYSLLNQQINQKMIPTPFSLLKIHNRTQTKVPMLKASNGTNSCGIETSMEYIFVVDSIMLMTSFQLKLFKPWMCQDE